jgi:hypothetical protein
MSRCVSRCSCCAHWHCRSGPGQAAER